jgi:integrase
MARSCSPTWRRGVERLTVKEVESVGPGLYSDGRGLLLRVKPTPAGVLLRNWGFRFSSPTHRVVAADGALTDIGKRRLMGLGSAHDISLATVRELARKAREQVVLGIDPIDARDEVRGTQRASRQAALDAQRAERLRERHTVRRVARDYHERVIEPQRTCKHAAQWISSIEQHTPAKLLDKPIENVAPQELLDLLLSLRATVRETGRRVGQRLGLIFADAKLRGLIATNLHADIRAALREPRRERKRVSNFAALPFAEVPGFVRTLARMPGIGARALEFTIRTAARTSESIGASWDEIDFDARTWTIPAERMKAGEAHVVYLTDRNIEILRETKKLASPHCFPSPQAKASALSNMGMLVVLRRMAVDDRCTVHGFRASFSTWAYEVAQRARPDLARADVIEASLAHQESNRIKAAYSRSRFEDDRRELLSLWSAFIDTPPARVADDVPEAAQAVA